MKPDGRTLTRLFSIPKMAVQICRLIPRFARLANANDRPSRNLFRAVATDLHFWIPLSVLLGGLFLLDKLR